MVSVSAQLIAQFFGENVRVGTKLPVIFAKYTAPLVSIYNFGSVSSFVGIEVREK